MGQLKTPYRFIKAVRCFWGNEILLSQDRLDGSGAVHKRTARL